MNALQSQSPSLSLAALRDASPASEFGGKAEQLAKALKQGLPVPEGFALNHQEARRVANQGDGLLPLDPFLQDKCSWAVRSSGLGEDSPDASFAGQYLTLLGVSVEAIERAIREVVDSADSAGASAYRDRMGLPDPAPGQALDEHEGASAFKMGIVIQRMVHATTSGVLFTRHPIDKCECRFIEASWGLGEAVVEGLVTPDQYRFQEGSEEVVFTAGQKDVALRLDSGGRKTTCEVESALVSAPCLNSEQLRKLDELARKCEDILSCPADIEWAFEGSRLYLLQMRPITI